MSSWPLLRAYLLILHRYLLDSPWSFLSPSPIWHHAASTVSELLCECFCHLCEVYNAQTEHIGVHPACRWVSGWVGGSVKSGWSRSHDRRFERCTIIPSSPFLSSSLPTTTTLLLLRFSSILRLVMENNQSQVERDETRPSRASLGGCLVEETNGCPVRTSSEWRDRPHFVLWHQPSLETNKS